MNKKTSKQKIEMPKRKSKQAATEKLLPLRQEASEQQKNAAKRLVAAPLAVSPKDEPNGKLKLVDQRLKWLIGCTESNQLIHRARKQKSNGEYAPGTVMKFIDPADVLVAFMHVPVLSGWQTPGTVLSGKVASGMVEVKFFPPQITHFASANYEVFHDLPTAEYSGGRVCFDVPMPAYLWVGIGDGYRIFAAEEAEFDPNMPLAVAPLPNVDSSGGICWGSNEKPRPGQVGALVAWRAFWEAPFTNANLAQKSQQQPNDVRLLLAALAGQTTYPQDDLVSIRRTPNDLLQSLHTRGELWD